MICFSYLVMVLTKDVLLLKAGLLAEGIYFSEEIFDKLSFEGKLTEGTGLFRYDDRKETPNELLLSMNNHHLPVEIRQRNDSSQTNFAIREDNDKYYLDDVLTNQSFVVDFPRKHEYARKKTSSGRPMEEIIRTMGTGYIRLYPDMRCDFAPLSKRCTFCGGNYKINVKGIGEIVESIAEVKNDFPLEGVFMSTGAFSDKERIDFYIDVLAGIRSVTKDSEIVFALAPLLNRDAVESLYTSAEGKTMFSYNMESFDPQRWDINNPYCLGEGKSNLGREHYFSAYDIAVDIGGRGNIKSNFVLGLDDVALLREGVYFLGEKGVFSSGTIFYPTPGSIWEKKMNEYKNYFPLVENFRDANERREFIVESYLMMMAAAMQNDLRLPWSRESRISGLEWQAFDYLRDKKNEQ